MSRRATTAENVTCLPHHFTGCWPLKESNLKSQFWLIRYALVLIQRICTRCCQTASVNPWRHCDRHRGHWYTCHELELSTVVAPSVSLRHHCGTVCLLTLLTLPH